MRGVVDDQHFMEPSKPREMRRGTESKDEEAKEEIPNPFPTSRVWSNFIFTAVALSSASSITLPVTDQTLREPSMPEVTKFKVLGGGCIACIVELKG